MAMRVEVRTLSVDDFALYVNGDWWATFSDSERAEFVAHLVRNWTYEVR